MIRTGSWTVGFFNIGHAPRSELFFGCATLGASVGDVRYSPDADKCFVWAQDVRATVISGTFEACARDLASVSGSPTAALVFFSRGPGAEGFLKTLHSAFPGLPVAGGTSAGSPAGELCPAAEDVSLMLLYDGPYEVFSESVQPDTGRRMTVVTEPGAPRRLARLCENGHSGEALAAWNELRAGYGIPEDDFECATLCCPEGVNIHMSVSGGELVSGADIVPGIEYRVCVSDKESITRAAERFCAREDSLILGCAGLKSAMLRVPATGKGSLAVYLYGEIAEGLFGNLMMTGIRVSGRND